MVIDLEKGSEASRLLDIRKIKCNSNGHRNPVPERNVCDYCFRTLDYSIRGALLQTGSSDTQKKYDKKRGIEMLNGLKR